jgi:hypothetical protein
MPVLSQQPPLQVCGPQGGVPASSGVHTAIMRLPAIVSGPQTSPEAHSELEAQSWTGPIGVPFGQGGGRQADVGWILVMQQTKPGGAFGLYIGEQSTPLPHDRAKPDDEPDALLPLDPPLLLVTPELATPELPEPEEPAPPDAEEPEPELPEPLMAP